MFLILETLLVSYHPGGNPSCLEDYKAGSVPGTPSCEFKGYGRGLYFSGSEWPSGVPKWMVPFWLFRVIKAGVKGSEEKYLWDLGINENINS
jgi:hypothetical protein